MEDIVIFILTETWLTGDIPNAGLYLKDITLHQNDRKTDDRNTKHRDFLISIGHIPDKRLELKNKNDYLFVKKQLRNTSFQNCCCYKPVND